MSTHDRIVQAAFELFEERGFEATTVDDVAERAGVGRTTFFRSFRSKEEVIFPDHDRLVAAIQSRLDASAPETALLAVTEAARIVLHHYLDEGQRARTRYRLVTSVPALRSRELAGQVQYQRTFRTFLHGWLGGAPGSALRAELLANAVVTVHNHVLRHWLRGLTETPEADFDAAMTTVLAGFDAPAPVAGLREAVDQLESVTATLRSLTRAGTPDSE